MNWSQGTQKHQNNTFSNTRTVKITNFPERSFHTHLLPNSRPECKTCTLFWTKMAHWYPIYDQNGWKTIPFGARHTYIAHKREYPPGGFNLFLGSLVPLSECALWDFCELCLPKLRTQHDNSCYSAYRSFNPTIQVAVQANLTFLVQTLYFPCKNVIFLFKI